MTDIFLSYSRDDRPRIEPLVETLTREGFDVWWDTRISSGTEFSKEIEQVLNQAKVVIVAWSASSVKSLWVADEASVGLQKGNLIPVCIDNVEPRLGFRQIQTINLSDRLPPRASTDISELLEALRSRLPKPEAERSESLQNPDATCTADDFDLSNLSLPVVSSAPFVGRDGERLAVTECLDRLALGTGGVLMIGGEPGVGKTRLAQLASDLGRERNMLPLAGHAYEERGAPFIVASEIIEQLIRIVPAPQLRAILGPTAPEIGRLVPELRRVFHDLPQPLDLPPDQQQRHLFNAMLEFMTRLSEKVPLVILLDDLHWADDSSIALLEHLAPHLPDLSVLLVVTYRDVAADMGAPFRRSLNSFNRQPYVTRLALHRLSQPDVAKLLSSLAGSSPPDAVVERIFKETEGNALFVQSVFQNLFDAGQLLDSQGKWRSDVEVDEFAVPDSLRLVIEQRLTRITPKCRQLLNVAAVLGLRFDPLLLESASDLGESALDAIEEAESAKLLLPAATGRDTRYEFAHALVRQALLETLSPLRRQRLHRKIADIMIERFAGERRRFADIAHHLYESGGNADSQVTSSYLQQAASFAQETAAFREAVEHLDRALDIIPDDDRVERARALDQRAVAKKALSDWPAAADDWQKALPVLEGEADRDRVTAICWELATIANWNNQFEESRALIQRGLACAGEEVTAGRCRLLAVQAHTASTAGRYEESVEPLEQAEALARQLEDPEVLLGEVMQARLFHCEHFMLVSQYVEAAERSAEAARQAKFTWSLANALAISNHGFFWSGKLERLQQHIDEMAECEKKVGNALVPIAMDYGRAALCYARGDLSGNERFSLAATKKMQAMGTVYWTIAAGMYGQALFLRGNWEAAHRVLKEADQSRLVGCWADAEPARLLTYYAYTDDRLARELLQELLPGLPSPGAANRVGAWLLLCAVIEAAALLDSACDPEQLYAMAEVLKSQGAVLTWNPGLIDRYLGIAATMANRFDVAEQHFSLALRLAESMPVVPEQGEVRRWWASMLKRRAGDGDRERARALLSDAQAIYGRCGMPKHEALTRSTLESLQSST